MEPTQQNESSKVEDLVKISRGRVDSDSKFSQDPRSSWLGTKYQMQSFYEKDLENVSSYVASPDSKYIKRANLVVKESPSQDINTSNKSTSFGTISGVYLPCVQNILGVILFLRLPWIVGQAGILVSMSIVLLCVFSTILTTLSMSALATNGKVTGGGPYGILLANLGPEFAGSIGILFYLGTTIAATMYTLGGIEALFTNFVSPPTRQFFGFDRQIFGIIWTVCLGLVVLAGMKYVSLASPMFLGIVVLAILLMTIGTILFMANMYEPVGVDPVANLNENLFPDYTVDAATGQQADFMFLLALFYPSVTGIMAGCNRSAVLKNPSRAIPKGTLGAITTTTGLYLITIILFGLSVSNETLKDNKLVASYIAWPHRYVVAVGILMSCVGAGMQSLAGAPQLLRSIANDGHIPFLRFFGTETMEDEPRKAVLLTTCISALACLAGNLDYITPIITMFFLSMYAAINAACFLSGVLASPSFRPTWRYFHWSTALLGFLVCIVYMLLISVLYAFVCIILMSALFIYIRHVRETKEWGNAMFGIRLNQAKNALLDLSLITTREHNKELRNRKKQLGNGIRGKKTSIFYDSKSNKSKCCGFCVSNENHLKDDGEEETCDDFFDEENAEDIKCHEEGDAYFQQYGSTQKEIDWRPQILVLCKLEQNPDFLNDKNSKHHGKAFRVTHTSLLQLASQLKKGNGLTIVNSILRGSVSDPNSKVLCARARHFLANEIERQDVRGFTDVILGSESNLNEATRVLFQSKGLGMLSPNTVMLAWPNSWRKDEQGNENDFKKNSLTNSEYWKHQSSYVEMLKDAISCQKAIIVVKASSKLFPTTEVNRPIDVWWLIHDGDMLVLLPYLLRRHKIWAKAELRIFAIADDLVDFDISHKLLMNHLDELRIDAKIQMIHVGASHARDVDQNRTLAVNKIHRPGDTSILSKDMFKPLDEKNSSFRDSQAKNIEMGIIDSNQKKGKAIISKFTRSNSKDSIKEINQPDDDSKAETVVKIANHIKKTSGLETQKWINDKYSNKAQGEKDNLNSLFNTPVIAEGIEEESAEDMQNTLVESDSTDVRSPVKQDDVTISAVTSNNNVPQENSLINSSAKTLHENIESTGYAWKNTEEYHAQIKMLDQKAKDSQRQQKRLVTASYLNEKILEHSKDSSLVILNLPLSRNMPTLEFIRYTEKLTNGLDRVIMLRGHGVEKVSSL